MSASTLDRMEAYPPALHSEIQAAANDRGYRIWEGNPDGWCRFRSATAPGEIAIAATPAGVKGPFYLSVQHPGAAQELGAAPAAPAAQGHLGAFVFPDREALYSGIRRVFALSISLPSVPYEAFMKETASLGQTEIDVIRKERIGQDHFRKAQMEYWNGTCPLTGIAEPALLRASHIIPWAECKTDQERLNVHNGLLLSALWDAAFDRGLVTFDDDGRVIPSPKIDSKVRNALSIETVPCLEITKDHQERLSYHRKKWQF
jgi:putative restriction endonuclease